jgi:3-hydroxyisobutyrate dehydrogenase-like beta-hydroxyacid dehydrogenase
LSAEPVIRRVAIIGFGEAASILGEDLARGGLEVCTYDILLDGVTTRAALLARADSARVAVRDSLRAAVGAADLIVSAVTASSSVEVARSAAATLQRGQFFLDINSVSPSTKRLSAAAVESSRAHYVESAVMGPLPPQRLRVPMLLGGPRAAELARVLSALGMNATAVSADVGIASAIKMCRSVVIKGLEALAVESLLAARRLGAEQQVLESLERTFPQMGWTAQLPDYLISRVAEHGRRRAAEMREVARTLEEVGIAPLMASATAARQDALIDAMTSSGQQYQSRPEFSWRALADALARPAGAPADASQGKPSTRQRSG